MSVNALFASLEEHKHDYAGIANNPNLKKFLENESESLKFSCKCKKLKKKLFTTMKQDRWLVLTNKAIYNYRPSESCKQYRWRVEFNDLVGLVVSRESDEMVLQVMSNKEGYRFRVESCLHAFVENCANEFKATTKIEMPLEITDEKDLEKYVHRNITVSSPSVSHISRSRTGSAARRFSMSRTKALEGMGPSMWNSIATSRGGRVGWLSKRKGEKDSWDPKFVILTPDTLRYHTPKIKGSFLLQGCKAMPKSIVLEKQPELRSTEELPILTERKDAKEEAASKRGRDLIYPFDIITPQRSRKIELAAPSQEDLNMWTAAFSKIEKGVKLRDDYLVQGWLWKKNPHDSSKDPWRKRYFMLHDKKCCYYEMTVKGNLNLAEGVSCSKTKVVRPTQHKEEFIGEIPSETQFSFRFNVNDAGRFYPFAADSRQDMDDWIMSVNKLSKEKANRKMRSRRGSSFSVKGEFMASLREKAPEGTVTIVFSGVQGISDLWNDIDGAAMGDAIDIHDGILREILRKFRGYEVKTEGTTFMVAFFAAWEALSWCLAVQEALVSAEWPEEFKESKYTKKMVKDGKVLFNGMRVHMGMEVGRPTGKRAPTTGRMDYYGPSVNKSARVAHAANGGQVLITDEILADIKRAQQVDSKIFADDPFVMKDMGHHKLKGIAAPAQIYEILPQKLKNRSSTFGHLHTLNAKEKHPKGASNRHVSTLSAMVGQTSGPVSCIESQSSFMSSMNNLAPVVESVSPNSTTHTPPTRTPAKSCRASSVPRSSHVVPRWPSEKTNDSIILSIKTEFCEAPSANVEAEKSQSVEKKSEKSPLATD